ncbi:hypothetical protein PTKIN_Ptkin13bG0195200 [Pterospermum kingtungense]
MELMRGIRTVPMAIVIALVIFTSMAAAASDPPVQKNATIVIECSQPDCQNKCLAAYGSRLVSSECVDDPLPFGGKLCVCYHTPDPPPPPASTLP